MSMVSVLLSVFNGAERLPVTLASLASQTYTDWELVAVDDASSDTSWSILKEFQSRFSGRVQLIRNEQNRGLTQSLNRAAEVAKGKFLARIDVGDEYFSSKLQQQVNFFSHHPDYGLIGCNYINQLGVAGAKRTSQVPETDCAIRQAIFRKNPFAHSCIVMRTDLFHQAGGYDTTVRYGQDYDLWFRLLQRTKAANLPEVLCLRLLDDQSLSITFRRAQMRQTLKTQWRYMNKLKPKHYLYLLEPLGMMVLPEVVRRRLRSK